MLLSFGGQEIWQHLALCNLDAGRCDAVLRWLRMSDSDASEFPAEAWAVLVETDPDLPVGFARYRTLKAPCTALSVLDGADEAENPDSLQRKLEAAVLPRQQELRQALFPVADALDIRAASMERGTQSDERLRALEILNSREKVSADSDHTLVRSSAWIWHHAEDPVQAGERLARAAKSVLWSHDPEGMAWGEYTDCASRMLFRPDLSPGVRCGMGHMPKVTRRFLRFFVPPRAGTPTGR
ncbi:MAG: hypothetical protein R3F17_05880 [Planctomycetota bacterium]